MKKCRIALLLAVIMIISVACGKTASKDNSNSADSTRTETSTSDTGTADNTNKGEVPQYGGTYTLQISWGSKGCATWDQADSGGLYVSTWAAPYAAFLLRGANEIYGPGGSGEYNFDIAEYTPEQYLTGEVAESWEWRDDHTLVFKIRDGVRWTGNKKIGMEPRQITAEDCAFSLNRTWKSWTEKGRPKDYLKSIYAEDDMTLVIEFNYYSSTWAYDLGYGIYGPIIYPPEVVEAGASDWRNQTGTGPFILEEYVDGSYARYVRNDDYWRTIEIDGTEYKLPFIDELIIPITSDESTRIAALKAGEIDQYIALPAANADAVKGVEGLINKEYINAQEYIMMVQCGNEKFKDVNVRRALMTAIDYEAMRDALFPGAPIHNWPVHYSNTGVYTPLEELPDTARSLYSGDKELAKKMLADAGYPNGFTTEIEIQSAWPWPDMMSFVADEWSKIGVKLNIIQIDDAAGWTKANDGNFTDFVYRGMSVGDPYKSIGTLGVSSRLGALINYKNEKVDELYLKGEKTADVAEREKLWKEAAILFLEDVPYIPMPGRPVINSYWSYIKNYHGEIETGFYNYNGFLSTLWIDQELKKRLGF